MSSADEPVDNLAAALIAAGTPVRAEWDAVTASTERCDRAAAEAAVHRLCAVADLPVPPALLWTDSPLAGCYATQRVLHPPERLPRFAQRLSTALDRLQPDAADRLRRLVPAPDPAEPAPVDRTGMSAGDAGEVGSRLRGRLGERMWGDLRRAFGFRRLRELRGATDLTQRDARDQLHGPMAAHLYDLAGGAYAAHDLLRQQLSAWSDTSWLIRHGLLLDAAGLPRPDQLDALAELLRTVGGCWLGGRATILVDRPTALHRDPHGRLHAVDGPALTWADGFALHAWHGTAVPAAVVTGTGWSVAQILRHRNNEVRRCAIERRGWDRFVTEAGLIPVGEQQPDPGNPGRQLRLYDLPDRLAELYGPPARLLLVHNASPDRDGHRRAFGLPVPADVPDAVAAAAATFDIDRDEYAALDRAT